MKAEDDEDTLAEPLPVCLSTTGDDDCLIARDHADRSVVLEGENAPSFGGPWAQTAVLVRGEAWFGDVDVWGGGEPWESVGDWLVLDLVDAECGLELRIAVHRSLDDGTDLPEEESDGESDGSRSSRYQSDDGFIVNDEEEEAVEASADAEFSDEEPPARLTGHMSREAARAAVDSPSFLNGLGDAAGSDEEEEEEEEEEEPIRRKRPRR